MPCIHDHKCDVSCRLCVAALLIRLRKLVSISPYWESFYHDWVPHRRSPKYLMLITNDPHCSYHLHILGKCTSLLMCMLCYVFGPFL